MSMSNSTIRVKEIRRNTRRRFSSEEKIRIVPEGLHKWLIDSSGRLLSDDKRLLLLPNIIVSWCIIVRN